MNVLRWSPKLGHYDVHETLLVYVVRAGIETCWRRAVLVLAAREAAR